MPTNHLFTRDELDALALSGVDRIAAALEGGDTERALAVFADVDAAYREFREIYHGWVATIFEHLFEEGGHDALRGAVGIDDPLIAAAAAGIDGESMKALKEAPERFAAAVRGGDSAAAKRVAAAHADAGRELHDWYRDWVSSLLSRVYRDGGPAALEQCLRYSSERGWMPWMMEDVEHDVAQRLREWTRLLAVGNFATISIEEEDDRFVIVQHPCGSCGRQVDGGDRGAPPWSLATVTEKHPITFCRGDVSAYRTHIAVMHTIMPLERIGAPWPRILCPAKKGEPCTILFDKDPRRAEAEDFARVGMKRGEG